MGGWDINCAFCGAPFHTYNAFDEDEDSTGEAYNPDLISAWGELLFANVFGAAN
jgi:hypothetical protein